MTALTLGEIADAIGGIVEGDPSRVVERVRGIEHAGTREIAVVFDPRQNLDGSQAEALVIPADSTTSRPNVIRTPDPRRSLAPLLALFVHSDNGTGGVSPRAFVAPSATLGDGVCIAPGAYVGERVTLGDRVKIHANAVIGDSSVLGDDCVIHPNVTIYAQSRLGHRVIVHAGTVIGSDGFGFMPDGERGPQKIPHLGSVEIDDDVEIGANCAVDRATLEVTRIGPATKIDNLVQIGHNSQIGPRCLLAGQVGISGSVTLGADVSLGGQVGISDHVSVGDRVRVGAKSGVHSSIADGAWMGSPVMPHERAGRVYVTLQHLPEYRERVRALEARVEELQKMIAELQERSASPDRTKS